MFTSSELTTGWSKEQMRSIVQFIRKEAVLCISLLLATLSGSLYCSVSPVHIRTDNRHLPGRAWYYHRFDGKPDFVQILRHNSRQTKRCLYWRVYPDQPGFPRCTAAFVVNYLTGLETRKRKAYHKFRVYKQQDGLGYKGSSLTG